MASNTIGATGLSGRYATALFELAESQGVLDLVADDLAGMAKLINENNELERMVYSPIIPREEQGAAMLEIMKKARVADLTSKFVSLLSANRRLFALREIIDSFLDILAQQRGELTAEVISAVNLDTKQEEELLKSLSETYGTKVSVNTKVDPQVLGGLIVKVGSRMVDSTLNTKLEQLRLIMRGV